MKAAASLILPFTRHIFFFLSTWSAVDMKNHAYVRLLHITISLSVGGRMERAASFLFPLLLNDTIYFSPCVICCRFEEGDSCNTSQFNYVFIWQRKDESWCESPVSFTIINHITIYISSIWSAVCPKSRAYVKAGSFNVTYLHLSKGANLFISH